jgi:putative aldouronate transport system substrate-binding protein
MKRYLAFTVVLLFIVAMFAGCGGKAENDKSDMAAEATEAPAATEAPTTEETPAPTEDNAPYNFAAGKFAADANGFATEKYDYELPLTTTDEVLQYWTTIYTPEYIPMEYNDSPFPIEVEAKTGVNVEYLMVAAATRGENFSVLIASDDLPDMMSQANFFYQGVFKDAILEENFFVNLYDYRDYMPNYIYEVMRSAKDDVGMYKGVFLDDTTIGTFNCLRDDKYPGNLLFIRGDWLKKCGINRDDIVTWNDTYEMLKVFKSQIDTAIYPSLLFSTIDGGSNHWTCFDTISGVGSYGLTVMVDADGKVYAGNTTYRDKNYMTEINKWYSEGLFDPDWTSFTSYSVPGFRQRWLADQIGYIALAVGDVVAESAILDDPDSTWMPVADPVLEKGQKIHVGTRLSRAYYGSAAVSTKCENIELAITWLDWRYSPTGSEVMSYGAEGYAWEYNEKGEKQMSELIYNNPEKQYNITMLGMVYANNTIADPGLDIVYARFKYPGGDHVIECYDYFKANNNNDEAYLWPAGLTLNAEQMGEANSLSGDLTTYITENYLAFVDGSKPLTEWDAYVAGLEEIGLSDFLAIYQEAYDAYKAG